MDKTKYKECYRVSAEENRFLLKSDEDYLNDCETLEQEDRRNNLGYEYTDNDNWYYQWDRNEKWYYIVVDKEN